MTRVIKINEIMPIPPIISGVLLLVESGSLTTIVLETWLIVALSPTPSLAVIFRLGRPDFSGFTSTEPLHMPSPSKSSSAKSQTWIPWIIVACTS